MSDFVELGEGAFVEEGTHVFYVDDGGEKTAVLPKDHLSDYCTQQLRKLTGGQEVER